ncbi:trk system potassium uptake protein TrkA [Halomicrobium zhouii]|uniref:Trk system potassium uptake protein TrkA n=1 Tax=Halomicrobium zhouii TaxID=767519 RepID=A0A1I6KN67_9EURY|nr:Trk system potassium transporter TrkA [Halomicrobium zhouii]SFR92637.1 trk system potassium uptake protein TrkA [Halomicrobium zhouii]
MHVIIVGAGQVGSSIAASLAADHDVVVVDRDPSVVESLTYSVDVLAIRGDGASLAALQDAGIDEADMLIACTDDDETNLVTCSTAKTVDDPFTIARVRNVDFLDTWNHSNDAFGVDFMVCTDLLTAEDVVRVIGLPAALDVDPFAGGAVQMAEFSIGEGSPVAAQTVAEADEWEALTIAALIRGGEVIVPDGDTVIQADDRAIVIGRPDSVHSFAESVAPAETPDPDDVVIIGGSAIAYQTAKILEDRGMRPRLIERDTARARELAEALPKTTVIEHDATDAEFLTAEHVDRSDVAVAALDSDEKNLLVSLLAKTLGVDRTVAIVENGEYTDLFETVGVDVAINPREATAEEIIRHTQAGQIENLSLIEGRQAEVLEIEVDEESVLANRRIQESAADLPEGVVIGAITRDGAYVVPRGGTRIEAGDHVVLFVDTDVLDDVAAAV